MKIQVALENIPTAEDFSAFNVKKISTQGRMATVIIAEEEEIVTEKIQELSPLYFEILPVTLEEIFFIEMEEVGYNAAERI